MSLATNASLYIPDAMIVPSNKALMFFEVSLQGTAERKEREAEGSARCELAE